MIDHRKAINPHPGVYAPDPTLVARLNELEDKLTALSVGKEPMSREDLIAAAKADLLRQVKADQPRDVPA
jgi:hypothetical protein